MFQLKEMTFLNKNLLHSVCFFCHSKRKLVGFLVLHVMHLKFYRKRNDPLKNLHTAVSCPSDLIKSQNFIDSMSFSYAASMGKTYSLFGIVFLSHLSSFSKKLKSYI